MFNFRNYQKEIIEEGTAKLAKLRIIMLAMEVRTGKTLTALGIANEIKAEKVLFVTKKKIIESKTIQNDYNLLKTSFTLELINYESVHKIDTKEIDLFIIDESHSIGAFPKPSRRAINLKFLIGETNVILLTGTPTPESWSQIYHQFWISSYSPFFSKSFYQWAKKYVVVKKKYISHGNIVNDYSFAEILLIKKALSENIISYSKEQAGFKSKINEEILFVKMKDVTYQLVNKLEKEKVVERTKGGVILGDTPVKMMQKIHQIYSGTVKLEEGEAIIIDDSKAQFIKSKFKDKKVAVFYKFKEELNLLKQTYGQSITEDIHEFNNSNKNIALQIVAGREGISLSKADCILFFNICYSATSYWQARDRLTTKERIENNVYWIFSEKGIEEQIYQTVLNKKSFTLEHYKNWKTEKYV